MAANPLPVASSGKDQQILTAFVLRARRIAAHSLAQDIETLRSHATEWKMNVDSDGRVSMVRNLPDEERFESLAARIRALTLKSEPIWYQTVIDAIQSVISDVGATIDADLTKELAALAELWRTWDTENLSMRGYHTELARITDPSEQQAETFSATDAQLGAGWFYADVAHADPKGGKAVALEYPIGSRFEAAVQVWSGLAVVVLRTLALLRELTNRGYLALAESAWTAPVTAESGEAERVSFSAYVAPVGTPVPPIGAARGPEWKELSVETVERLLGIFHLVARFVDEGGAELGVWPATTSRRTEAGKLAGLDLRLDDLLDFHLPMPDVAQADVRVDFLGEATSNRELHRKLAIQRALFDARQIVVEDQTGTLMMRYLLNGDFGVMTMEDRVALEACTDLVRLEELADAQFGLLEHLPALPELVRRRVLRLLLEGKVTYAMPRALEVETSNGQIPAMIATTPYGEIIDAVTIPVPALVVWHPEMIFEPVGPDSPRRFRVTVPPAAHFLTWAPSLQASDFDPSAVTPTKWGLPGLVG